MRLLLEKLRQRINDRRRKRKIERARRKIEQIQNEPSLDEDMKIAAINKLQRKVGNVLDDYIEGD